MDKRKSSKADLEPKRTIFIELGMIIALAVVLAAFEWKSYDKIEVEQFERIVEDIPEEIVPITEQKNTPPPPKPPPQTTIINIVEDDVEIEEELIIDAEADDQTEVEEYVPVESEEEEEVVEQEIFMVVEEQPGFPGGDIARLKYLAENIKYPQMARESGVQGMVYVTFVVEPDGRISNVRILRGIGGGCDEEAVRVIKAMPRWKAGKQRGKSVRVQFNMPIKFTLQG